MRNLKLTLAYDGTPFSGWQIQSGLQTVQGEVQRAIETILSHPVVIHGSGRTDAGVHAHGQVANFSTESSVDTDRLLASLNALLQAEIRVLAIDEAEPDFQARLSATSKTYEYHLWRLREVSPFQHRFVAAVGCFLDLEAMDRATGQFVGTHDFTSFCAASTESVDRVRTVHEAVWSRGDKEWVFRIRASGFLRYMVRTIVGTLIEVGRSRIRADQMEEIFAAKDRRAAGPSAPAQGLHLVRVDY